MCLKQRFLGFLILLLAINFAATASQTYPALRAAGDPVLQQGLEKALDGLGLRRAVDSKHLSVALVDLTYPTDPRLAAVNGDEMMYAASLPKIAILLGAFERIAAGDLVLDAKTREQLTQMVRFSSNKAATAMLNRVGKRYLANLLQSPRYRFYDASFNGGLWVGKEYGRNAAWRRDPLHNLSHGATVLQVARFYYWLETGRLVSPKSSQEMKSILADPALHHKFVKGLDSHHPDSRIYRKSGTWKQWHADSAIVERDGRRYIAVALANSAQGGQWLSQLIVSLDDLIFRTHLPVAFLDGALH